MTTWRIEDVAGGVPVDVAIPEGAELAPVGRIEAVLRQPSSPPRTVLLGPARPEGAGHLREVVVDGWRFELAVSDAGRAALRERATREQAGAAGGGPLRVRAVIPGRVVAIAVAPGDLVTAGEPMLIIEAMKMQNELRAPRDGTIGEIAVTAGSTVERGDLLLVLT
ncbi:MAG TPA: biotin/lipoyl-containing protein [Candidatus Limnocylindrales bacterium]|nr:biotin/lipoyl-containing protein [Candidatus Limnocylindrales bacterium]